MSEPWSETQPQPAQSVYGSRSDGRIGPSEYTSGSLIFPTGVHLPDETPNMLSSKSVRSKVYLRLDQCEAIRFPFQKKLMLDDLQLTEHDIPMKDLCGTTLGNALYKLSLAKNRLGSIPPKLVTSLPALRVLDLSQCELHQWPEQFHLPSLAHLNLRHNRFTDFPDEGILEGLPELQELDMYGNKVSQIVIPTNSNRLAKLETLDLGYNNLVHLPDELDQLRSLRTLNVMNNRLSVVPMRVCAMNWKSLNVSNNPIATPPWDTCERGMCAMKRFWVSVYSAEPERAHTCDTSRASPLHACRRTNATPSLHDRASVELVRENQCLPSVTTTFDFEPSECRLNECQDGKSKTAGTWTTSSVSEGSVTVEGDTSLNGSGPLEAPMVRDHERRGGTDLDHVRDQLINVRLEQCTAVGCSCRKRLMLDDLAMTSSDIPLADLCGTALGETLFHLSLAKNRLVSVPPALVMSLTALRVLDLAQCELFALPEYFDLPNLRSLGLRHNRLTELLDETALEGLPELRMLDLYGNKVLEIVIPTNPKLLTKLETLDLGYNDIIHLPDELDQLRSLRTLKLMNNFLSVVPRRVCDMDLKILDVTSNPVTTPPLDTCERGIYSMKRYWAQIGLEEQNRKKQAMAVQSRLQQRPKTSYTNRLLSGVMGKKSSKTASSPAMSPQLRKAVPAGNSESLHPSEKFSASTSSRQGTHDVSFGDSSDQSTGSLLCCKTRTTSAAAGIGGPMSMQGSLHGTNFCPTNGTLSKSRHGAHVSASSGVSGVASAAISATGTIPVGPTGNGSGSDSSGSDGANGSGMMLGNSVLGKSSSLICPTGVDTSDDRGRGEAETSKSSRSKVNLRLDQCEAVRFPFKKKLMLDDLHLTNNDIPMKDLCGTTLGNALYKLSLAKNRLGSIPPKLVTSLPALRILDLSQCELHQLPEQFHLPRLARLNLRHNRFTYFPDEGTLEGLPELQELDMYGNKVSEIVIPTNPKLLTKLETLDLGYNDIIHLPDELDQLRSLRTLKLMNNFLSVVPRRVCDMDLKILDVTSNPVMTPPYDTCEHGICSMKRYWAQLRLKEQKKRKQAMAV